ncbi:uncharacterized protein C2orf81 homolog [Mobula hypostoma]|uniref:uncharacterized protein C2orf81 homolog n=1 Tax=Mobula hypostoma TaxID=723540 RepID=UPI002FC3D7AA
MGSPSAEAITPSSASPTCPGLTHRLHGDRHRLQNVRLTSKSVLTSSGSGGACCPETAGGRGPEPSSEHREADEPGIMSRSAMPKSRLDKSRAALVPAPAPVAALVELVPGRFTENDWQAMVAAEDGENSVMDIIEDVISQALDQCFRIYIENQLLPFTITQAKDALLQIIEWQFLIHDPGESNITLTPSWQEDAEPQASVTDSWAQGSVPVLRLPDTALLQGQESMQEPPEVDLQPEAASADHSSTLGDHEHGAQGSLHSSSQIGFYPDLKQVSMEPEEAAMDGVGPYGWMAPS